MAFLDDYEPVEDRLAKFWAEHPDGQINTEYQAFENGYIVRASVWRNPLDTATGRPDGTGLAQETVTDRGVNSTSALENCETSAIGRALAAFGLPVAKEMAEEAAAELRWPPGSHAGSGSAGIGRTS